jgi:hypothetical protein
MAAELTAMVAAMQPQEQVAALVLGALVALALAVTVLGRRG